jgi:tight adherence protein C
MCDTMNVLADMLIASSVFGTEPWWDVAIAAGLFTATFLLVVAVFGQPGRIRMSAQREAALAMGHTDRKTVFEKVWLQPVMWMLLLAAHRLALPRLKAWLRRTLVAAGSPEYYTPEEYLALSMLTGLVLVFLIEILHLLLLGRFSLLLLGTGLFLGVGLSIYQIYATASKRLREITRRVPYSLDLIALAMGAGATFTEAVQTVVREKSDDPLNVELRTMLAEMDLGTTRRQALENLGVRVPLEMLRGVVASIIQAEELGTPLADVLHSEATLMRLHRSVRAENAAAVASVRILIPSLLILMSVVLAIFGPAIIQAARRGLF